MVLPQIPSERVLVRRNNSAPFLANVTGSVRIDLRQPGAKASEVKPGPEVGLEVKDDRGFILFCQRSQVEPATPEMEEEFKTDLSPRFEPRDWSDPLMLGRVVMTP